MSLDYPGFMRRLAALFYDALLCLGLVIVVSFSMQVFSSLLSWNLPSWFLEILGFCSLAAYFVYCWSHSGQTLALRTWGLRLVLINHRPLSVSQALWRFFCCWGAVLPAYIIHRIFFPTDWGKLSLLGLLNAALWFGCYFFTIHRQAAHDIFCKTIIIKNDAK